MISSLRKYQFEITYFLALVSIAITLANSENRTIQIIFIVLLVAVMVYQWTLILRFKKDIIRANNIADNVTLEVVNRFRNRKELNPGLDHQSLDYKVSIDGFDAELENVYEGTCGIESVEAIFFEVYADSNIVFEDLHFEYYNLLSNPEFKNPYNGYLVEEDNKLFLVRARFPKVLLPKDPYKIKFTCKVSNCMNYGDDYYVGSVLDGINSYDISTAFLKEKPEIVELFDATKGGDSGFLQILESHSDDLPYTYVHSEKRIRNSTDFVYKFTRVQNKQDPNINED
jgi:hypothetical protein